MKNKQRALSILNDFYRKETRGRKMESRPATIEELEKMRSRYLDNEQALKLIDRLITQKKERR